MGAGVRRGGEAAAAAAAAARGRWDLKEEREFSRDRKSVV